MVTPLTFFGISTSTTLSAIKNIEYEYVDHSMGTPSGILSLTSRRPRNSSSGLPREDGHINGALTFDISHRDDLTELVNTVLGGWSISGVERALSLIDESGYYSPHIAWIGKPIFTTISGWRQQVSFPLTNARLQAATKSSNATITTSEHYVNASTGSGNVTLTLPAVATVNPYVIYSFVKSVSASNSMILDGDGSELINNATTLTITALNGRADIYTDNVAWYTVAPQ